MAADKNIGALGAPFDLNGGPTNAHKREAARDNRSTQSSGQRYLTRTDVAERLQVSVKTVDRWIKSGELPAAKLGGLVRISERDLAVLLAKSRSAAW
jgi:excisionase family DNA binding protein